MGTRTINEKSRAVAAGFDSFNLDPSPGLRHLASHQRLVVPEVWADLADVIRVAVDAVTGKR